MPEGVPVGEAQHLDRGLVALDEAVAIDDPDRVGRGIEQVAETLLGIPQLGFRGLDVGDVVVDAEHADHFVVAVPEGNLGSSQPDGPAIRRRLPFVEPDFRQAGFDDLTVIGAVELRLARPAHLEIIPADQVVRGALARIQGKEGIASQIVEIVVFPEHAHGHVVHHGLEQVPGFMQGHFGLLLGGDVLYRALQKDQGAVGVIGWNGFFMDPANGPVRQDDAVIDRVGHALPKGRLLGRLDGLHVIRMHPGKETLVAGFELPRLTPEDAEYLVGPVQFPGPDVQPPVADMGDVLGLGQVTLAGAQPLIGALALGDVPGRGIDEGLAIQFDGQAAHFHIDEAAILAPVHRFEQGAGGAAGHIAQAPGQSLTGEPGIPLGDIQAKGFFPGIPQHVAEGIAGLLDIAVQIQDMDPVTGIPNQDLVLLVLLHEMPQESLVLMRHPRGIGQGIRDDQHAHGGIVVDADSVVGDTPFPETAKAGERRAIGQLDHFGNLGGSVGLAHQPGAQGAVVAQNGARPAGARPQQGLAQCVGTCRDRLGPGGVHDVQVGSGRGRLGHPNAPPGSRIGRDVEGVLAQRRRCAQGPLGGEGDVSVLQSGRVDAQHVAQGGGRGLVVQGQDFMPFRPGDLHPPVPWLESMPDGNAKTQFRLENGQQQAIAVSLLAVEDGIAFHVPVVRAAPRKNGNLAQGPGSEMVQDFIALGGGLAGVARRNQKGEQASAQAQTLPPRVGLALRDEGLQGGMAQGILEGLEPVLGDVPAYGGMDLQIRRGQGGHHHALVGQAVMHLACRRGADHHGIAHHRMHAAEDFVQGMPDGCVDDDDGHGMPVDLAQGRRRRIPTAGIGRLVGTLAVAGFNE